MKAEKSKSVSPTQRTVNPDRKALGKAENLSRKVAEKGNEGGRIGALQEANQGLKPSNKPPQDMVALSKEASGSAQAPGSPVNFGAWGADEKKAPGPGPGESSLRNVVSESGSRPLTN